MKLEVQDGILRGLPLAVLITIMVQGAGAIWWVSAQARDNNFIEQRVEKLEASAGKAGEVEGAVLQRLARIEERLGAQSAALERIERKVGN
ncbi:MAG TPA: hypothetical protein DCY07_01690 [Rhodospirillaceae bacterium]|nr:hypothetical protein [Rhodospirillaceae bacterium]